MGRIGPVDGRPLLLCALVLERALLGFLGVRGPHSELDRGHVPREAESRNLMASRDLRLPFPGMFSGGCEVLHVAEEGGHCLQCGTYRSRI